MHIIIINTAQIKSYIPVIAYLMGWEGSRLPVQACQFQRHDWREGQPHLPSSIPIFTK